MRWWILFPGLLVALLSWDAISLSMAVSSGVKWSHYPPALLMLSFAPLQVKTGSRLLCWLCALAAGTRTCLWQLMGSEWPGLVSIWHFGKGISCLAHNASLLLPCPKIAQIERLPLPSSVHCLCWVGPGHCPGPWPQPWAGHWWVLRWQDLRLRWVNLLFL